MKSLIVLIIISIFSFANSLKVNDSIGRFSLPNQFDKKVDVNSEAKMIIVTFEKDTSSDVNAFLNSKNRNFLVEHKALYIADISQMPSIITRLFALPKMRKYAYEILLIYSEDNNKFSKEDEKISIYKLNNGVIQSIEYINKTQLEKVFN